jgi:hypothetical protein
MVKSGERKVGEEKRKEERQPMQMQRNYVEGAVVIVDDVAGFLYFLCEA